MDNWERNTKTGSEIFSTRIYSPPEGEDSVKVRMSTNFPRSNV